MKKKWILSSIAILALIGGVERVNATCAPAATPEGKATPATMDWGRSINGIVVSVINLIGDGESQAQLIAEQEENNERAGSGSGGGGGSTEEEEATEEESEVPGESEFTGSAYSHVQAEVLAKEGNIGYEPLKKAVASGAAELARQNIYQSIVDNFFVDLTKPEQTTTAYQEQIQKQRQSYVEEATKRHVILAYKVKGFIQNDLSALPNAAISAGSELASLAINGYTLEQMVKMELVDLALQIEMMEADAIQFLMHQTPVLMTEKKPNTAGQSQTTSDNGTSNNKNSTNKGGEQ